jgi:predicted ribosomally synthesized peptide with SipW-like signal peptide
MHKKSRMRAVAASVVVLAALAGVLALGVSALFTDQAAVGDNDFTTGTVDINTSPVSEVFTVSNMAPGDTATEKLDVTNGGTLQLKYGMSTGISGDAPLAGQIDFEIRKQTNGADCDNNNFTGTTVYTGKLDNASIGAGSELLNAGATQQLCMRAILPHDTGNAFQGKTTTATFTFAAAQTANNP